jgi:beta-glucosidase
MLAISLAFNAGLDVELPGNDCAQHLPAALERGLISMATIDTTRSWRSCCSAIECAVWNS